MGRSGRRGRDRTRSNSRNHDAFDDVNETIHKKLHHTRHRGKEYKQQGQPRPQQQQHRRNQGEQELRAWGRDRGRRSSPSTSFSSSSSSPSSRKHLHSSRKNVGTNGSNDRNRRRSGRFTNGDRTFSTRRFSSFSSSSSRSSRSSSASSSDERRGNGRGRGTTSASSRQKRRGKRRRGSKDSFGYSRDEKQNKKKHSYSLLRPDLPNGSLDAREGDVLAGRYVVRDAKLGEGTFGTVLRCRDTEGEDRQVALKAVRAVPRYASAAHAEARVMEDITRCSEGGSDTHCLGLLDQFEVGGHVCLVFELCGPSVYDVIKAHEYAPLPEGVVRVVAKQMLEAVAFLHSMTLVHTDLKPENILFVDRYLHGHDDIPPERASIRVIDFGNTTYDSHHHTEIVCTRHYRGPEVVVGMGWSYSVDIWAAGCIIFEMATGNTLFQTHKNVEHLAMMENLLGPVPAWMVRNASEDRRWKYFDERCELKYYQEATQESRSRVRNAPRLEDVRDRDLRALLREMIQYDPVRRPTAEEALEHVYFTRDFADHTSD